MIFGELPKNDDWIWKYVQSIMTSSFSKMIFKSVMAKKTDIDV